MSLDTLINLSSVAAALFVAALAGLFIVTRNVAVRTEFNNKVAGRPPAASRSLAGVIGVLGKLPVPASITHRLGEDAAGKKLSAAGSPLGLEGQAYIRAKITIELVVCGVLLAFGLTQILPAPGALGLLLVAGLLLWILPDSFLKQLERERVEQLNRAVPDLLDMLVVSVEGGLSLQVALRRVAGRFPSPLGDELRHTLRDMNRGAQFQDALRSMASRTSADEIRQFTVPFLQAQTLGVPIAQQLRNLADDMRTRRKQRAQDKGRRAATMVLLPMMLCILPSLLITVIGPALMSFFSSISGR